MSVLTGSSERLRYEPIVPAHASMLSESLLDPAVYTFISGRHPTSTEELTAQFERKSIGPSANRSNERWWNIAVLSADCKYGLGRIEATIIGNRAEVAYLFGPKHWGRGFAHEAMLWLHDRLAEDRTASELWATVLPSNERSIRLLKRLGYTQVSSNWPELSSYDEGDMVFCYEL